MRFQSCLQGWRAVWVSHDESLTNGSDDMTTITKMKIIAPENSQPIYPLYFDLLRLVEKTSKQSRDKIVPTLDESLYNSNHFWQQTYRWSQVLL